MQLIVYIILQPVFILTRCLEMFLCQHTKGYFGYSRDTVFQSSASFPQLVGIGWFPTFGYVTYIFHVRMSRVYCQWWSVSSCLHRIVSRYILSSNVWESPPLHCMLTSYIVQDFSQMMGKYAISLKLKCMALCHE